MADATNALDTLGEILPRDPGRDAIHLATYAVKSDERLFPGQHIGFVGDKVSAKAEKLIGIVDPFLPTGANPGEMFWLVLYPRSITSLRHVWTHPEFTSEKASTSAPIMSAKETSEAWLRNFISTADSPGYELVIAKALDNSDAWDSEYLHFDGRDAHGEIPPEFWDHVEIVTGEKIEAKKRASYFSCSC